MTQACTYTGLDQDAAISVAKIFYYSNPQYFFLSNRIYVGYYGNSGAIKITVYDKFQKGEDRVVAKNEIASVLNQYLSQVESLDSDVQKQKKIHDLVVSNVTYEENEFDQSIYSTLILQKTVCAGYAGAYAMLCNAVGIDTLVITSLSHAWNYSRLNQSWYAVDCTWDDYDGIGGYTCIYTFYNRSSAVLTSNDQNGAHGIEVFWNKYKVLVCSLDSGATKTNQGIIYTPVEQVVAPEITRTSNGTSSDIVTITTTTKDARILYTVDGSEPSEAFTKSVAYSGAILVDKKATVKSIAVANTYYDSNVVSCETLKEEIVEEIEPNTTAQPTITPTPQSVQPTITPTVIPKKISSCKVLGVNNKTYTGKTIKQKIKIYDGKTLLKEGTDYKLSYKKNKPIGTATIIVTGRNSYKGTATFSFNILPKKITIKSVAGKKKAIKVTWKKGATVTGYQVQIATAKNLKKSLKTLSVKKATTTSVTIGKLKANKNYYIRVRAYKKIGKKTYYGSWSSTKLRKTK